MNVNVDLFPAAKSQDGDYFSSVGSTFNIADYADYDVADYDAAAANFTDYDNSPLDGSEAVIVETDALGAVNRSLYDLRVPEIHAR